MCVLLLCSVGSAQAAADRPLLSPAEFSFGNYSGEVLYLDFWATWCSPCLKSFPWMEKMRLKYADQRLRIVAVAVDGTAAEVRAFADKLGAAFDIVHDPEGKLAAQMNILGMPTSYIYDRSGQLQHTHVGFRQADLPELEMAINHVIQLGSGQQEAP